MRKPIPSDIADWLRYDPETGAVYFQRDRGRRRCGEAVGKAHHSGYRRLRWGNSDYQLHRVAWFLATGEQPPEYLDHVDLNRANNKLANLRAASATQNNANRPAQGSGLKGVCRSNYGRFQAQVSCFGKAYYLGTFETEEAAHAAYVAKATELFGEHARAA